MPHSLPGRYQPADSTCWEYSRRRWASRGAGRRSGRSCRGRRGGLPGAGYGGRPGRPIRAAGPYPSIKDLLVGSAAEELLDLVHPGRHAGLCLWLFLAGIFEFRSSSFWRSVRLTGVFDDDVAHQVTMHCGCVPLMPLPRRRKTTGLGFRRNLDSGGAIQRRNFDLATQGCGGEEIGISPMQVAVTREDGVLLRGGSGHRDRRSGRH